MKIRWLLVASLMVMVLAISACAVAPGAETVVEQPEAAVESPAEAVEEVEEAEEAEEAEAEAEDAQAPAAANEEIDVEALIVERLENAHTLEEVLNADITTREEWEETIDRMIGYGAKITPEEKELIIDWLLSR